MRAPWGSPRSTQMQKSLEGLRVETKPPATHVKKTKKKKKKSVICGVLLICMLFTAFSG